MVSRAWPAPASPVVTILGLLAEGQLPSEVVTDLPAACPLTTSLAGLRTVADKAGSSNTTRRPPERPSRKVAGLFVVGADSIDPLCDVSPLRRPHPERETAAAATRGTVR